MSLPCKAAGGIFTVVLLALFAATVAVVLTKAHDAYDRAKLKGEEEAMSMAMASGPEVVATATSQTFADMENITAMLATAYAYDNVKCDDATLAVRSNQFLRTAAASVRASPTVAEVFAAYRVTGTGQWGSCGCRAVPAATAASGLECHFTNSSGVVRVNGLDVTRQVGTSAANTFPASEAGRAVAALTQADCAAGVWGTATASGSKPFMQHVRPAKVTAAGAVTEAAGVRLDVSGIAAALVGMPDVRSDMVMLDTRAPGGLLLGTNNFPFEVATPDRLRTANETAWVRINDFVNLVRQHTDGWKPAGATAGFYGGSKALNFAVGGMLYSVRAVLGGRLMLLQRAPQVDSAPQVSAAVAELLATLRRLANTMMTSYVDNTVECQNAGQHLETTQFYLQASMALMKEFQANVVFTYASYKDAATGIWGDCGCGRSGRGDLSCSYINGTGWYFEYNDAAMTRPTAPPEPANDVAHQVYIQHISNLTTADRGGVWIPPSNYNDPSSGAQYALATYSIPFEFGADGKATAAMSIDIAFADFNTFLRRWNAVDGNELVLLDTKRSILLADSRRAVDYVQPTTATKYPALNGYMREVQRQQGDFKQRGSFTDASNNLYNTAVPGPNFALVEVVRPEEQPAWFDPRGITTKNAKARFSAAVKDASRTVSEISDMYTSGEKAAMYLLVAVTVVVLLIDRVVLLVLSGLGSSVKRSAMDGDADYHKESLQGSA